MSAEASFFKARDGSSAVVVVADSDHTRYPIPTLLINDNGLVYSQLRYQGGTISDDGIHWKFAFVYGDPISWITMEGPVAGNWFSVGDKEYFYQEDDCPQHLADFAKALYAGDWEEQMLRYEP